MVEKKEKKVPAKKAAPKKAAPKAAAEKKTAEKKTAAKAAGQRRQPPHPQPPSRAERGEERPAAAAQPARAPASGVHGLGPAFGATHSRKRVGRGPGSGHGKTAGRGHKGQKSRSGYHHQRGFEGGQMPLHRRVPKRGFTNIFRVEYDIVNLSDLGRFEAGQAVDPETLRVAKLAGKRRPIKILGNGEIGKALTVSAHKFSVSAKAAIEAAGGRCEVVPR